MQPAARFLSILFHPLLLITYGSLAIFELDAIYRMALNAWSETLFLGIIFLGTFLVPSYAIWLLKLRGKIDSLEMEQKEDRKMPLMIAAIFVLLTFYLFSYKLGFRLPHLMKGYLLASATAIILAAVINNWYKISLHGIGIGGFLALLMILQKTSWLDLRPLIAFWVLLCGLIAAARIYLKSHNNGQIYSGFLAGFILISFITRL